MSRPLSRGDDITFDGLNFEQRAKLRAWLVQVFRDIHRVTRIAAARAPALIVEAPFI